MQVKSAMGPRIAQVRRSVTALDPWGVNSRLLQDYDALATSLEGAYADAKLAAIRGDTRTLEAVRADFDQRLKKIADWLAQAEREEEGEGEGEGESERERERPGDGNHG